MKLTTISVHDIGYASKRRPVDDEQVKRLADSIEQIGLQSPVVVRAAGSGETVVNPETGEVGCLYALVSGAHRLAAFYKLERYMIPAFITDLDGLSAELAEIDENLVRNELTALERSEQLARRKEVYEALYPDTRAGIAGGLARQGLANEIISFAEDSATKTGKSRRTIEQDVKIANDIVPDVKEQLRGTPLEDRKVDLLTLSRMKPDEQRRVIKPIVDGRAANLTQAKSLLQRRERVERINEIARGNEPLATAERYPIIYADPPWRYEHVKTANRAIENHYPTMSLEEICALPVGEIATPDAMLFMWATNPKLAEAMRVIEAWGFTYRTNFVWVKDKIGMGYYARGQHELLLVARRGDIPVPDVPNRFSSVVAAPRGEHSAKPEQFYELIEAMYPEFPKIELFARQAREGWAAWGNQAKAA